MISSVEGLTNIPQIPEKEIQKDVNKENQIIQEIRFGQIKTLKNEFFQDFQKINQTVVNLTEYIEIMEENNYNIKSKCQQQEAQNQKLNQIIIQLKQNQIQKNLQLSDETQKFQNKIKDLESQLLLNELLDLNNLLKTAENKISQQVVNIQQINVQLQEKEIQIINITQQNQQYFYQLQQWQQYNYSFQQQVTQQNQIYEFQIKELREENESLNQKLKTENTKVQEASETINELQTQLSSKEIQNQKQETLVKKLQQQIADNTKEQEYLETEKTKAAQQGQNITNETLMLEQELQKFKKDYENLQSEKEKIQVCFESFRQQHKFFANQAFSTQQTTNQEHEEKQKCLFNKINLLNNEIENLKKQLSDAQKKIKDREAKIEQAQQEHQKLQLHFDKLNSTHNSLNQEKKHLEQTTQQLQNELTETKRQYEAEKTKYRMAENEKTQLKRDLQKKEIELTSEKVSHKATIRDKKQFQDQFKELYNEAQSLTTQVQVAEKKIERVLQNFGDTKLLEKITGPLDNIMTSVYKINRFTEDPNSQLDNAQYNLIEITLQFDKYTQYVKEGKYFLIDECFQFENKINITATRSIQPNAESEFYKGYLIKIIESTQADLKTKTLLRKDLKQLNEAFYNKEEAARLAVNNIFCQWLQIQFNKDLVIAKLQPQKQTIHRQFIIENEAKKEYYYCEMVEEGPFQKINGGYFVPQKEDVHQYFNALSLYSNKLFKQELILTNFQVCGDFVYDMIVHTNHKRLFSPLDQGPYESPKFSESITKQLPDFYSKGWNEIVRSQAEKYLR